jgi:hypothetical protein
VIPQTYALLSSKGEMLHALKDQPRLSIVWVKIDVVLKSNYMIFRRLVDAAL